MATQKINLIKEPTQTVNPSSRANGYKNKANNSQTKMRTISVKNVEIENYDIEKEGYNNISNVNTIDSSIHNILDSEDIFDSTSNFIDNFKDWLNDALDSIGIDTKLGNIIEVLADSDIHIDAHKIEGISKTYGGDILLELTTGTKIYIDSRGYISTIKTSNDFSYYFDKNGNIIRGYVNGRSDISIFGTYNLNSLQYGGSQLSFSDNVDKLLQDPIILNILNEYFPNATLEDYEYYLYKVTSVGCGYTALINSLFVEYEGKEEEFLEKFGFPMYNINEEGDIDFNYEYLILEFFSYIHAKCDGYTIQEIYGDKAAYQNGHIVDGALGGNLNTGKGHGTSSEECRRFSDFLKEKYDIDIDINVDYWGNYEINADNYLKWYGMLEKSSSRQIILCSAGFDLYNLNGNLYCEDVGSHAMYITGLTDDGRFIVSSWGNEFIVDFSNLEENNGYIGFVYAE